MHVEGSASILALIELNHLTKTFKGKTQTVDALKDINLHIEQGNIFGIIGMSGAGKSTLVRCINFLEQPTSGSVVIDGKDLASLSPKALRQLRQQVSMIFQHFNLLSQRDVRGNIAFAMEIAGMKRPQIEKRIDELLEIVGLTDRQHNYPSQLSGGQQQRVAIARALATNPKIILCDEATSALDPTTTTSILNLLREINRRMGITIVIITHEMSVVESTCTHVAIIDDGQLAECGTVESVFSQPKSAAAYPRSSTRGRAGSARWHRRSGSRHFTRPCAEKISIWSAPAMGRIPRSVSPAERYCAHRSSHASGCSKSSGSTAQTW